MQDIPRISEAEWEIMKIIWKKNPITSEEILEALSGKKDWTPQTVKTFLNRLVNKHAIGYTKSGRNYLYSPILLEKDCIMAESRSFLQRVYNGALGRLVSNYLEEETLSEEEIEHLQRILMSKKKGK